MHFQGSSELEKLNERFWRKLTYVRLIEEGILQVILSNKKKSIFARNRFSDQNDISVKGRPKSIQNQFVVKLYLF